MQRHKRPVERESVGRVTNVSVDWLTATATSPYSRDLLWSLGHRVLHEGESKGQLTSRWHANGYRGWRSAGVNLGERADTVILRLSGPEAAQNWVEAAAAGENLSRCDVAVDVECDPPVTRLALEVYKDAGHMPSKNGRPPKRSRVFDSDGGQTTYIGARSSETYGRLYDKGRETKTLPSGAWWRWEVEFKGEHAWGVGNLLTRSATRPASMLGLVAGWFRSRSGHAPPQATESVIYNVSPRAPDDDRLLQWLTSGVAPTVRKLIERVGRERVLLALGLSAEERSAPLTRAKTLMRVS
jgi:hypothetical protein